MAFFVITCNILADIIYDYVSLSLKKASKVGSMCVWQIATFYVRCSPKAVQIPLEMVGFIYSLLQRACTRVKHATTLKNCLFAPFSKNGNG